MESNEHCANERLENLMEEVEGRVQALRKQALFLKKEKESILELLQEVQDAPNRLKLSNDDYDDMEYNLERLILRCLTVEVSVITPRNEAQEDAYSKVSEIVDDLQSKLHTNPLSHRGTLESHLNASLPEPLSSNINLRFQEKLLGCTVEDQKYFREKLEKMMRNSHSKVEAVQKVNSSNSTHTDYENSACKNVTEKDTSVQDVKHTNGEKENHDMDQNKATYKTNTENMQITQAERS